jgi:hypothetical protein
MPEYVAIKPRNEIDAAVKEREIVTGNAIARIRNEASKHPVTYDRRDK